MGVGASFALGPATLSCVGAKTSFAFGSLRNGHAAGVSMMLKRGEAKGPTRRGPRWSQSEGGPHANAGGGLGGPKAKEAPAPMRQGHRWSQSARGPGAHAAGASRIAKPRRPARQSGEGFAGPKAKQAPMPMQRGG